MDMNNLPTFRFKSLTDVVLNNILSVDTTTNKMKRLRFRTVGLTIRPGRDLCEVEYNILPRYYRPTVHSGVRNIVGVSLRSVFQEWSRLTGYDFTTKINHTDVNEFISHLPSTLSCVYDEAGKVIRCRVARSENTTVVNYDNINNYDTSVFIPNDEVFEIPVTKYVDLYAVRGHNNTPDLNLATTDYMEEIPR